jgi:putative ABC transport system permease protein
MPNFLQALIRIWLRPFRALGAFSLLWFVTLALGIAVTSVCYTQLKQTVLQPLAFPNPEQLVAINRVQGMCQGCPVTAGLMADIAAIPGLLAGGYTQAPQRMSGTDLVPASVAVNSATPNFFGMLAAPAALGRNLRETDADTDAIMLSDATWRSTFNASPDVIGKTVRIGAQPKVIAGVLAAGIARVAGGDVYQVSRFSDFTDGSNFLSVIARIRPSLSGPELQAGLQAALAMSAKRSPVNYSATDYQLVPQDLLASRTRWVRETLTPVLAIVLVLALLMAANASSLFAVSVLERINALSTEMALGAERSRLLAGVAAQALSFTFTAALLACLLSPPLFELTRRYLLTGMTSLMNVQFDWVAVIIVACGFAILNVVAAVLPAAIILKSAALTQSERVQTAGAGSRFSRVALAVQLVAATSVVMLALLLVRTMDNLSKVDPGFDLAPIWTVKLILPEAPESDTDVQAIARNAEFMRQTREALGQIPGVASVAFAGDIPLGDQLWNNGDFIVPGAVSKDPNQAPYAQFRPISAGYSDALGIKLISGKIPEWHPGDVVIEAAVNQEYVSRYMAGIDPVGRVIEDRKVRIVGVLASVKQVGLSENVEPDVYAPFAEFFWYTQAQLIVRGNSAQPIAGLYSSVRAKIQRIDASVPLFEPQTGFDLRQSAMRDTTLMGRVVLCFASLALLTTALGLFGLCAFSVAKRKREFGLRLAIGAAPRSLIQEILRANLNLSMLCAGLGLVLGFFLSQLIAASLFGVARADWASALGAVISIAIISAAATFFPAWRASRTDPMEALRA